MKKDKPASIKCPRCRLDLRPVDYEGVETDMCDGCWGVWLDSGELEAVLERKQLHFSKDEAKVVLDFKLASEKGPTAPAPCPRCGKIMERKLYDELVSLVIDRCEDHGVWLDTGELKKAQVMAEKSAVLHKLLLKKLGLIQTA